MKTLIWYFKIRGRIKKRLVNTVREEGFFESERIKNIHAGKPDIGNYLGSKVELKREVANVLRSLLN